MSDVTHSFLGLFFLGPWLADVDAALARYEVVVAASTAGVLELLTHPGRRVVVETWDRGGAGATVKRVQAQHRDLLLGAAVVCAGGQVGEAVGVAMTATVVEGFTLHRAHVIEVSLQHGSARALLRRHTAHRRHLGDSEAGLVALLVRVEVVGVALAAAIEERLTFLAQCVVVEAREFCTARPLLHRQQAHGSVLQRQDTGRAQKGRTHL